MLYEEEHYIFAVWQESNLQQSEYYDSLEELLAAQNLHDVLQAFVLIG